MELQEIAIKNSGWTWDRLREARSLNYQVGEESITDFLVLNIKKWGKGKIVVDTFTRHKEAVNGSDWEWWFTGPSGKWLGMRIQAKVLNLISEKYEHLHHNNKNGQQVDLLVSDAKINGLVPLYCMYTNWKPGDYQASWKCITFKPSIRHYGAAILSPYKVKSLQKTKDNRLASIIDSLRPMHCIFCCTGFSKGDLPSRALGWLKGAGLLGEPGNGSEEEINNITLKDSPPYYVTQLLEHNIQDDFIDLQDTRLKRVTVFRETDR
ncbi:MAG: DUF6615 family protein [Candidatus Thiodiazotropha endolucinida]